MEWNHQRLTRCFIRWGDADVWISCDGASDVSLNTRKSRQSLIVIGAFDAIGLGGAHANENANRNFGDFFRVLLCLWPNNDLTDVALSLCTLCKVELWGWCQRQLSQPVGATQRGRLTNWNDSVFLNCCPFIYQFRVCMWLCVPS